MRRSVFLLVITALGILAIDGRAEEKPDFTGTWAVPPARVAGGAGGSIVSLGSGWGTSFTLLQDEDTLILRRVFFARSDLQPAMTFRFALDGSETKNTVLMGRGQQVQVSTCVWDGDKLVIRTVHHVLEAREGKTITSEVSQTLSLERPRFGRSAWPPSLVIETVRSGVLGGPSTTTRTIYDRN